MRADDRFGLKKRQIPYPAGMKFFGFYVLLHQKQRESAAGILPLHRAAAP